MPMLTKEELISKDISLCMHDSGPESGLTFPSERQMAQKYDVSRKIIHNAYLRMIDEGLIANKNRKYVRLPPKEDFDTADITGQQSHARITNNNIYSENGEADKVIAQQIKQPLGTRFTKYVYVRTLEETVEKTPISFDTVYVPINTIQDDNWMLTENSVLKIISMKYHYPFTKEEQAVRLIRASGEEANHLSVPTGTQLVCRTSLFLSSNSGLFLLLTSYKIPKMALLVQPDTDISRKVGGFIE